MMSMRTYMNIVEESTLLENPMTSILAALGNKKARGQKERYGISRDMKSMWDQWLGRTGLDGSMNDMKKFLYDVVGFEPREINSILKIDTGSSTDTEEPVSNLGSDTNEPDQENREQEEPENDDQDQSQEPEQPEVSREIRSIGRRFNEIYNTAKRNSENLINQPTSSQNLQHLVSSVKRLVELAHEMESHDSSSASFIATKAAGILQKIYDMNLLGPQRNRRIKVALDKILNDFPEYHDHGQVTSESIMESEESLSPDQVDTIFDDATKYIFQNNLVGSNAPDNRSDSSNGYTGSTQTSSTNTNSSILSKVRNMGFRYGVDNDTMKELSTVAREKNPDTMSQGDRNAMGVVGWAFLKSL